MITAFAIWLDCHYNKHFDDIYFGTVVLDIVGMISTAVLIYNLAKGI